jgi:hypothetical protein
VQNERIAACKSVLLNYLVVMVKSGEYFSVIVHEQIDIFSVEQFSCYAYKDNIREDFLKFEV